MVVIARWQPIGGKGKIARVFWLRIHLPVGHQSALRGVEPAAHVVGIADFVFDERFAGWNLRVPSAGADKNGGVHRITWHEFVQHFFRGDRIGVLGEPAAEVVRVNLHRHIDFLQIVRAKFFLPTLVPGGTEPEEHQRHDKQQRQDDDELHQRETGSLAPELRDGSHTGLLAESGAPDNENPPPAAAGFLFFGIITSI